MALADALAAEFNRPGHSIVDHHTYVFLGDGCLMEGISHEACSLAGTLGLGKLIAFYDDNGISIDGPVQGWFTDNTPQRFAAYGWHVVPNVDGHDSAAIETALKAAQAVTDKPSLICCKTIIGKGAPKRAGRKAHGARHSAATGCGDSCQHWLAARAVRDFRSDLCRMESTRRKCGCAAEWDQRFAAYAEANPELAREFDAAQRAELPARWRQWLQQCRREREG